MTQWSEDIIPAEVAGTLGGLFRERVRRSPQAPAYRNFDRDTAEWVDISWSQMRDRVAGCQQALAREGLRPGDSLAILMRNGPDWVMFDQAALGLGLVVVPLYTDDRPDNIAYILNDAGVSLLVVQDRKFWSRMAELDREFPTLKCVVIGSGNPGDSPEADERLRYLSDWIPQQTAELQTVSTDPGELASIVYTSGTTGRPKGVMLSHTNMLFVANSGLIMYDVYTEDILLSFLPLSHTFERSIGYYLPMMAGATVAYARSVPQLAEDLQAIRPTALIAVPRIFERVYARIHQQLAKKSPVARALFHAAVAVGWRRFLANQGRASHSLTELFWPLLNHLVAAKIMQRLGGRLRLAVSGGAALPVAVARTFIGLGLNLTQGYGLTETAPVVSGNPPEDNDPASVGVALSGVEVRIGDDDELLVKSPGIMLGYWNNHAATREIIDSDGWLHTGDQARIEQNHIYITGRIKDILVLSNGEKVPPADMEMAITLDPLIDQAMIIGEGKAFLGAILVLNPEEWVSLANHYVIDPYKPESLADNRIQQAVTSRIAAALSNFPGYAKVRRVILNVEPWTVDNGLATPTMKVKRNKVMEHFAQDIERLYTSGPASVRVR